MSDQRKNDGNESPQSEMSYGEQVDHLAAGYANSQSVVRFLDTKAAAVLGVVPVVLGVLGALFKWQLDVVPIMRLRASIGLSVSVCVCLVMLGLSIVLLVFAWRTVYCVFGAILPRTPGDTKPSILFPYHDTEFGERLSHFLTSPTQKDALEDYQRQLTRMSMIVAIKIERVEQAIGNLKRLFLWGAITIIFMVIVVAGDSIVSLVGNASCVSGGKATTAFSDSPAAPPGTLVP